MTNSPDKPTQEQIDKAVEKSQKLQERKDCLRLLKIMYEAFGYPAGCQINNDSGLYVPGSHMVNAKAIRQEMLNKQINRAALSEAALSLFKEVITRNNLDTPFKARERINRFMMSVPTPQKENEEEQWALADVLVFRDKQGNELQNDMKQSWIIRKNGLFYDVISGRKYTTLTPCKFKQ